MRLLDVAMWLLVLLCVVSCLACVVAGFVCVVVGFVCVVIGLFLFGCWILFRVVAVLIRHGGCWLVLSVLVCVALCGRGVLFGVCPVVSYFVVWCSVFQRFVINCCRVLEVPRL